MDCISVGDGMMKVNEIFYSIEGEGIRAGSPAVFIRLSGCNLNCSYCDTKYHNDGELMSVDDIIASISRHKPCLKVTLTGGEPLIHPDVKSLLKRLEDDGYEVNIETNGSVLIGQYQLPNTIITMDYKCPSSGEESKMMTANLITLREQDVLKFVVGSQEDLERARTIMTCYPIRANVFISPVFGKIEPKDIVEFIKENKLVNARVQVQLHKVIWDVSTRGV